MEMVYYHNSSNVKILRSVIKTYEDSKELSPCEYMKLYIESYGDITNELKRCWIVETFLDIMKHKQLLEEIITYLPPLSKGDTQEYVLIILHGIIFQIPPSDIILLYKCLFNLSKSLLSALSTSLKADEFLTRIFQIAQTMYDTNYVTEKIMKPLLEWQPSMEKMAQNYAQYLEKAEKSKVRKPTIPVQPQVLKIRKSKSAETLSQKLLFPATPPNSVLEKPPLHMLTKETIDKKLKHAYEINKHKALKLLCEVKNNKSHQAKHDEKLAKSCNLPTEIERVWTKTFPKTYSKICTKEPLVAVKDNVTTIKRLKERIKLTEEEEVQWLQDLINNCKDTTKIQELEEYDREERERERMLDIERKHLLGQISFEEALIAKKKVQEDNKMKYEEVIKQKEVWNKEIENWNKEQMEINRKTFEKLSLLELNVLEARRKVVDKKKEDADKVKKETEAVVLTALKNKQDELDRKIQMIKEIKVLSIIAKRAKLPKILDLTETSGIGLLCEMSIAELQERLSSLKISLKEDLEAKNKLINEKKIAEKNELEQTKKAITSYKDERKKIRESFKKPAKDAVKVQSKEINDLKSILKSKRELRLTLMNQNFII